LALSTVSLRVDVIDNATPQLTKIATGLGTFQQKATSVLTSSGQLAGAGQGFSGALAGFNTQLNTVGTSAQTLGQRLGTLGTAIAQQGTAFGVASASVIGVASSFLSLEKASVRSEAAQVRVRTLTTTLAAQTERLRIAREKGNLTDGQMAVLESRIADTQDKLGVAQERATVMQNDYNETLSSFATQLGPQVIAAGGSIAQIFAKDPQGISGFTRLKTAISGLISPMSGFGSGATKVTQALSGLSINLEGAGSKAGGFGSALSGIGGKLSGLVGTITPIAAVLAAGVGAWLLYQHTMEQVTNFRKDFAIVDSLNTVEARVKQVSKAFDDLKDPDLLDPATIKKTLSPENLSKNPLDIIPFIDPGPSGLSKLLIHGKDFAVDKLKESTIAKEKEGSVTAVLAEKQKAYNDANDAYINAMKSRETRDDESARRTRQKALDELNAAKAVVAHAKGTDVYTKALAQSVGPQDAFTRGALGLGNQLVNNISVEDQLAAARSKGIALSDEDQKNYVEASLKKQAADKLFALGQINARESMTLTREELLLIEQAYQGTAATSAVAIEKLSTTTVGLRGSVGQAVSAFLDAKIAAVDYSAALTDVDLEHRLVQQGTLAGLQAAEQFFQGLVKGTAQEQAFSQALNEGAQALGIHSDLMSFSSGVAQELVTTTYKMNQAFSDQAVAAANDVTWLQDMTLIDAQLKAGMIEGAQAANDWTIGIIKSSQAAKDQHAQLLQLAADMLQIPINTALTTDQLQILIKTFQDTKDTGQALATTIQGQVDKAFQGLSSILTASKFSDFKKAFKDMDFGDAPKKFVSWAKDFDSGLRQIVQHGPAMNSVLTELVAAANNGVLPLNKLHSGIGFLASEMKKIDKKSGLDLSPVINFLNQVKKMSPDEFLKHADAIQMIIDAVTKGDMSKATWDKIIKRLGDESKTADPSIRGAAGAVDTLVQSMQKMTGVSIPNWIKDPSGTFKKFQSSISDVWGGGPNTITQPHSPQAASDQKFSSAVDKFQGAVDKFSSSKGAMPSGTPPEGISKEQWEAMTGNTKNKNYLPPGQNEFTTPFDNPLSRMDVNRHKPTPGYPPVFGYAPGDIKGDIPVLPGQNILTPNARPIPAASTFPGGPGGAVGPSLQINNAAAIKAIDVIATRIMDLAKIQPVIVLQSAAAIKAVDVIALRLNSLTTLQPIIVLQNADAIKAVDVIALRLASLTTIVPTITVINQPALAAVGVIAVNIFNLAKVIPVLAVNNSKALQAVGIIATHQMDLAKLNPVLKVNNSTALKAVGVIAQHQMDLAKLNPTLQVKNSTALKAVGVIAQHIMDLEKLNPTVTVHVKVQQTGKIPGQAKGGIHYAAQATNAVWGEGGPEIAAFFPLVSRGSPRKGDYDIVVPTPHIDASGIRNTIRDNIGFQVPKGGSSTVHVHLNSPIYLFPGGPQMGRLIRQYVFDEISKYGQVG